MEFRVRFRFNKATGEVEVFEVSDEKTVRMDPEEHDQHHDRTAGELARLIDREPEIREVMPGSAPQSSKQTISEPKQVQAEEDSDQKASSLGSRQSD